MYDCIGIKHGKHFGREFPDKKFFVIRRLPPGAGLLSNYHWVLNNIYYALSKEYIPVVNMENYKTFYNENIPIENEGERVFNAWEYYFEQPCGYSLKDIRKASNVILGSMYNFQYHEFLDPLKGKMNIAKYFEIASQYCKMNTKTMEYLETKKKLFDNKKNILGVSYRGTDYLLTKNHYTPPSIEQISQKTLQVIDCEKFDYIFLKTEEQKAVDEFYKVFPGETLLISEDERIRDYDSKLSIPELIREKSSSVIKNGLDYLTDVLLLAQCDGIIASKNNGTAFALGWNNNKYRYSYLFDLGMNT